MVSNFQIPGCVEHNHLAAADIPVCWTHTKNKPGAFALPWSQMGSGYWGYLCVFKDKGQECQLIYSILVF